MRAKRAKAYKKVMSKYQYSFGHRPPYQVLLDDQFIVQAAANKMRLGSMLQNTLGDEIKPMITQCCIRHLYIAKVENDGQKQQKDAWIDVAKQAERRRCGHHELEEPLSTLDCMLSVVDPKGSGTNKHRYVVSCQEPHVRARMREIAGVPLVYINRSVMILEPMAAKSTRVREADEKGKIRAGLKSGRPTGAGGVKRKRDEREISDEDMPARAREILAAANATAGDGREEGETAPKKRKVKGPKGPNPLSVKKVKKEKQTAGAEEARDEPAALRKTAKKGFQAAEGASDTAAGDAGDATTEAARKRKRKRRPKEGGLSGGDDSGPTAALAEGGDED